jgi:CubicO group peptidase (beta-lactamase class C family)
VTALPDAARIGATATWIAACGLMWACAGNYGLGAEQPQLRMIAGGATSSTEFERLVEKSMRKASVAGLAVAIINDRKIVYTNQFGWKNKDTGSKPNDTTVFAGASLSKTVFAYLTLLLANDGLIDLDKPLHEYLPRPLANYTNYADLGRDARYRLITARMVLSHTTGLPNLKSAHDERLRLEFTPGTRFSYSGEGFRFLQLVVETVTKKDLETLARERVFLRFGMAHTSFVWRDGLANNVAAPHNEFEWAADPDRPPIADAAGSLLTTAHDYARFLVGLLAGPGSERSVVQTMWTPQVRIASGRMFGASAYNTDDDGKHLSWALGWGAFDTPNGRAFFHTGHKAGAQNYAVVFPDRGTAIVLFSNSDNFESVAAEIVAAGIGDGDSPFEWLGYEPFDSTKRKVAPPRLVATSVPSVVIAGYAGAYQLAPGAVVHIKADGDRLYASDDGKSWDELLAHSETLWFFKGRSLTITFVKDGVGRVTGMEIDNNGAKLSAQRIR